MAADEPRETARIIVYLAWICDRLSGNGPYVLYHAGTKITFTLF
jgi:hypothetical protein